MKKLLLSLTLAIASFATYAQTTNVIGPNGNVGIATLNPSSQLAISGTNSINPNNTGAEIPYSSLTFQNLSSGGNNFNVGRISSIQENGNYMDAGALAFSTGVAGLYERMRINTAGNVLIGQTTQKSAAYILDVNGSVRANAITVNATGADFVFAPSYKLLTLPELNNFIQKNHHLPEIASAKEMQANGLNLGDNQVKLLQKVEELTLYLIEKDEKIGEQQRQINEQEKRLEKLEATVMQLTAAKVDALK